MFFIDDDQTQVLKRQKQRRSRANNHLCLPLPRHFPYPAPFCHRHTRMPFSRHRAKTGLHPGQKFTRKCNFGEQNQGLLPTPKTFCDGFQVHLCFARPGDAA